MPAPPLAVSRAADYPEYGRCMGALAHIAGTHTDKSSVALWGSSLYPEDSYLHVEKISTHSDKVCSY